MIDTRKRAIISLIPFLFITIYALNFMNFAADEYTYMNTAHSLISGYEYLDLDRFPLFPFLLSLLYIPFGSSELISKIFVIFLGVSTLLAVFFTSKKIFDEKTAYWATLILSTSPLFIFFGTRVLTEMLFMLIFLICIYLIYISKTQPRYLSLLGFFSAVLFLTRYVGLYVFFILFAFLFLEKKRRLIISRWFLACLLVFFLTLSPYLLISYGLTGNPIGLILSFFGVQYGVSQGLMSWPDRIPSFFLALPFILGATSLLLWRTVYKNHKKLLKGKFSIFTISVLIVTLVMELFYLNGTPLLRYIIVALPPLSVIASHKIDSKKIKSIASLLIIANFLLSLAFVYTFNTAYQKHIDYRLAGLYARENCQTYSSNIEFVMFFHTKKLSENMDQGPECIIFSKHDAEKEEMPPENYSKVEIENLSEKILVFKKS